MGEWGAGHGWGTPRCGWELHPLCRYVERYGLPEASDNIRHVLKYVAVTLGKTQKVKVLTGTGEHGVWGSLGCGLC